MMVSETLPLFDDQPPAFFSLVEVLAHSKPATKAQQAFERLVRSIEGKREELARWQAFGPRYQRRVAAEVLPLQASLRDGQRQMAFLIDELLSQPSPGRRYGKVQRAKLRQLLLNLLAGLLEDGGDGALEALYEKHAGMSHAEARQSGVALTQAMLEDVLGVDIGDDHAATSAEELLAHAATKLREQAEAQTRIEEARRAARPTAKQTKADAAQATREAAAQEAIRSIREVYRKLASALHPDRETDAAERGRKTRLMQRVNDAYAARDLLTLLGLQLEIEQIDAEHLATVSPQRLRHYTQVLRDQLAELESELAHCVMPFRIGAPHGRSITPALADQQLSTEIVDLKAAIRELHGDLVAFRDLVKLRAALAHYPLDADADDSAALDDLSGLLDVFAASIPPRRSGRRRR